MKLKDLSINIFSGGTPSTTHEDFWNGEFYWLSSGETKNTYIRETEKTITKLGIEKSSTRLAKVGDVVVASAGQGKTRGQVAYCLTDTYINQSIIAIRAKKEVLNSKYLFYNLSSRYNELRLLSDSSSSRGSLTVKIFEELNIDLPEIEKQNKIAKVLSNYDDLIENNNRRIKILEEMAQKIYKEWFVDFKFPGHETATFKDSELGKIPSNWEIKEVSDISKLYKGKSYKSSELCNKGEGLPFLNLKCIERDGGFKRDGLKYFNGKYNNNHIVYPEDIIMAVTDMTQERRLVARPARIPHNWYKKYVMSMDLVKLIPSDNMERSYLYSLLKYSNFSDEVKNHANGANVLHLNPKNIEQFELVVADKNTRDKFGEIVNQIYSEIDVLYFKNENLKQTRDILLPRLIAGEIDVEKMEVL